LPQIRIIASAVIEPNRLPTGARDLQAVVCATPPCRRALLRSDFLNQSAIKKSLDDLYCCGTPQGFGQDHNAVVALRSMREHHHLTIAQLGHSLLHGS